MNPKESVCLSIDDQFIKIVKGRDVAGKRVISGCYVKSVSDMTPHGLGREISTGLDALGARAREVTLVVPSKYVITKNIEVPSLDPQEIESIVKLQAVRHTPYTREEVIVSHINLERLLERYTKSLLVIVPNEFVRTRTDAIELAGASISTVRLSSEVVARSLSELGVIKATDGPCIFLSFNEDTADFLVVNQGRPYFLRNIPFGVKQFKEDSANTTRLFLEEIKKTNEAYQAEEHGTVAKRMILDISSAKIDVRVVSMGLESQLGLKVAPFYAEQSFDISAEAQKGLENSKVCSVMDAMACVFAGSEASIDLLPEEVRVRKAFREKGREVFTAGIFALIIFGLVISAFLTKVYFRGAYLEQITKNFDAKQKDANELMELSEKTRLVKNFKRGRGRAIKVLTEAQTILPEKMYVGAISLTPEGKLVVKGTSELMSTVFSFVTVLENHPYFKSVNSDFTKSRKENDKDVSDFGISASLEEGASHAG